MVDFIVFLSIGLAVNSQLIYESPVLMLFLSTPAVLSILTRRRHFSNGMTSLPLMTIRSLIHSIRNGARLMQMLDL
ncbi:hypothetical protein MB27_30665 [Actinoplanes utahensis]|uniref:Uncharacterized protein n=1 Tax=Actinoplanes utahensis TaxID=1869 RepID=A0A0A6UIG4_ACTUT|nr:hypothetical protein MB27_30665 [Actinoplanes utahensis]